MFDTGIKENIVNKISDINWDDPIFKILGGGRHDIAKMRSVSIMAPITERPSTGAIHDKITFSGAPTVGDLITIRLVFKTLKAGFADFDNNNVTGGKTLSFSFKFVSLADTATRLASVLLNSNDSYSISAAIKNAGANATDITYKDTSIYVESVNLVGEHNTTTVLAAALTHPVPARLGRNTSKELKDSVRAATKVNYGPEEHTLEKQVDMNNNYYAISFNIAYNRDERGEGGIINGRVNRVAEFIYYINESIYVPDSNDTGNPINEMWVALIALAQNTAATTIALWASDEFHPIYFSATDTIGYPAI